jgi:hypothetical protein
MPDEDIMAVTTLAASEEGGTYKTLSKRDIPITTSATLIPCKSKDTSVRLDCGGGPVEGPVSVRGFSASVH